MTYEKTQTPAVWFACYEWSMFAADLKDPKNSFFSQHSYKSLFKGSHADLKVCRYG
jgi:hypothetical protein